MTTLWIFVQTAVFVSSAGFIDIRQPTLWAGFRVNRRIKAQARQYATVVVVLLLFPSSEGPLKKNPLALHTQH